MLALQLIPLDAATIQTILTAPAEFERQRNVVFAPHTETILEHLNMTADLFSQSAADIPWISYIAVRTTDKQAVGSCAFKQTPRDDGSVEIGYGTYPPFENCGVATTMTTELVRIAQAGKAQMVIAHTLDLKNASSRVLAKAGFRFVGETYVPEDGHVCRWEYRFGPEAME
jgi:[ribosomal protein S5]-alanine N-acetyltransferase